MLSQKEMRRELPQGKIRVLMSGEGGRNGRTGRSGRQGMFHRGQCHKPVERCNLENWDTDWICSEAFIA